MAGDRDREKNGNKTEVGVGTAQGGDVPRNGYREGKGKDTLGALTCSFVMCLEIRYCTENRHELTKAFMILALS